jgi:hypothetical protein
MVCCPTLKKKRKEKKMVENGTANSPNAKNSPNCGFCTIGIFEDSSGRRYREETAVVAQFVDGPNRIVQQ